MPAMLSGLQHPDASKQENRSAKFGMPRVDVHDMWDRTSLHRLSSGSDSQFRGNLAKAYLTFVDGMSEAPTNAHAHLWTELPSLHALYRPTVKSDGSEVEIPHSLLAAAPVTVHLKGELDRMIDQQAPSKFKNALSAIRRHPLGENIGARADMTRALYTNLHVPDGEQPEHVLNMHIDVDTLSTTRLVAHMPDPSTDLKKVNADEVDNIANAKTRLLAMKRQVDAMTLPRVPAPLSSEEAGRLVGSRQIPLPSLVSSSMNTARRPLSSEAQNNIDRLREFGFSARNYENDVLAVVPASKESRAVLEKTARNLYLATGMGDESSLSSHHLGKKELRPEDFSASVLGYVSYLRRLNGVELKKLDWNNPLARSEDVFAYISLAEGIRKIRPAIQDKIDSLTEEAERHPAGSAERENAQARAQAFGGIYEASCRVVQNAVNEMTYEPQGKKSKQSDDALTELTRDMFGATAPVTQSLSWNNASSEKHEGTHPMDAVVDAVGKSVFREIKAMLPTPMIEDFF